MPDPVRGRWSILRMACCTTDVHRESDKCYSSTNLCHAVTVCGPPHLTRYFIVLLMPIRHSANVGFQDMLGSNWVLRDGFSGMAIGHRNPPRLRSWRDATLIASGTHFSSLVFAEVDLEQVRTALQKAAVWNNA
jgi:hypothetical protein